PHERKKVYNCDVVYVTNNEVGFDYLRDNMVYDIEDMVHRDLHYAIIDEVDNILIDEARTPLIISGRGTKASDEYHRFARLVKDLNKETDYTVDEKAHSVPLTEEGVFKVEKYLGIENLYDNENMELTHQLTEALKAKELFKRDVHYVIKDQEIIIVDEFTGRLMFGRRYSDGLHQAIEAKEGVKVRSQDQTLATITFQNFFRLYDKLAGMTGTAATEEEEFRKIYGMDVVVIPTNMAMVRDDRPDVIYKSEEAKLKALIEEIAELNEKGAPVLVGTRSVEMSERLSKMLHKRKIPHNVLNAKYHEKEAEIIAQAGRKGTVTISTNMAGRGTDIILGGDPAKVALAEFNASTEEGKSYDEIYKRCKEICQREHDEVVSLGGLHILGSERHESRRIDNQLRGRSGRQGDPGSSRFYIALEDELMRLFGSDKIQGYMEKLGYDDSIPIEHPIISKQIEAAQSRVEAHHFSIRKNVLEYDEVMNQQREVIYGERRKVLSGEDLTPHIMDMIDRIVQNKIDIYANPGMNKDEWDIAGLIESIKEFFLLTDDIPLSALEGMNSKALKDFFLDLAQSAYKSREEEFGTENFKRLEQIILLRMIDTKWIDHLDIMDNLRDGIGLRGYGGKDPRIEYEMEAFETFQEMMANIQEDTVTYIMRARPVQDVGRKQRVFVISGTNRDESAQSRVPVKRGQKIGRNDPCPCGSGKKYKKCCISKESVNA
ncbi:MAG TPA: preprotein translocase subunit SecA, partial [Candidatus Eremiobacteraeota bacterium]|nr:preprotein translocase subunit SecA [Candidatus Eremiobacteraeota bacterium]